jgi:hypothetical protein
VAQLRQLITTPEIVVRTWRATRAQDAAIGEDEVRSALLGFDPLWQELFPTEQARIIQLLIERIDVREDGLTISLITDGLASLVQDLRTNHARMLEAA